MLSDITFKYCAMAQLAMYEKFRQFAREDHSFPVISLTAVGVCTADTCLDTVKYPVAAIENLAFAVLNTVGSPCIEQCRLKDAYQNLKKSALGLAVATPFAGLVAIPKFLAHLSVTLSNPAQARTFNREAEAESRLMPIIYTSSTTQEAPSMNSVATT